jgi:hypothetical protein
MKTLLRESVQDLSESNNNLLPDLFYKPLYDQDEFFYKSYPASSPLLGKESGKKFSLIKRITPFLILEVFLMGFFPYMFLTGKVIIQSGLVTALLFPFTIINLLFLDFALCNYFEGKKIFRIWFIELVLSFILIYLLV